MTNIEQLESKTSKLKDELSALKNDVSLSKEQKKEKADRLKTQVEETKTEVKWKIEELASKSDKTSEKEKKGAESILQSLDEVTWLYNSITWGISPNWIQSSTEKAGNWAKESTASTTSKRNWETTQTPTEDKNIFVKAKDWIWEQWDCIQRKDKRHEEWWKNLLRTAWFVLSWAWAVALLYKWVKKLWNRAFSSDKKETSGQDTKSWGSWNKESWRERLIASLIKSSEKKK